MRSNRRITPLEFGSQPNLNHCLFRVEKELTFYVAVLNTVPWKDSSMQSARLILLPLAEIFHVRLP